jgi:hypothetical protein
VLKSAIQQLIAIDRLVDKFQAARNERDGKVVAMGQRS